MNSRCAVSVSCPILIVPFFGSKVRCHHYQSLPLLFTPAMPVLGKALSGHTVPAIVSFPGAHRFTHNCLSAFSTCPVFFPLPSAYPIARGSTDPEKPSWRSSGSQSLPTLIFLWSPGRCDKYYDLSRVNLRLRKNPSLGIRCLLQGVGEVAWSGHSSLSVRMKPQGAVKL